MTVAFAVLAMLVVLELYGIERALLLICEELKRIAPKKEKP